MYRNTHGAQGSLDDCAVRLTKSLEGVLVRPPLHHLLESIIAWWLDRPEGPLGVRLNGHLDALRQLHRNTADP
eukprot:scaffold260749_cov30-Tisochrysis_lutea.AAC.2